MWGVLLAVPAAPLVSRTWPLLETRTDEREDTWPSLPPSRFHCSCSLHGSFGQGTRSLRPH